MMPVARAFGRCLSERITRSSYARGPEASRAHMISFIVNGKPALVETSADTPLLWVLRDVLESHWNQVRLWRRLLRSLHCAC